MSTSAGIDQGDKSPDYRYWAFISYSHADQIYARKLHAILETWKTPRSLVGKTTPLGPVPPNFFPIFRDRDELATGENLHEVILAALKTSRYLIVICSPRAAASKYVNKEIEAFKAMQRSDRILYFIVDGEPNGGQSGCFPPMARRQFIDGVDTGIDTVEPIAADARKGRDGRKGATLKVLARLLDVSIDVLQRRERTRVRRLRIRSGLAAAILTTGIAFAYLFVADAGYKVPLGDNIRHAFDRRDASVFRPAKSVEEIRASAKAFIAPLGQELENRRQGTGWIIDSPPSQPVSISIWSQSQGLVGLLSYAGAKGGDFDKGLDSIDMLFTPEHMDIVDGVIWGWHEPGEEIRENTAFMPIWTAIACSKALQVPSIKNNPAIRARISRYLETAQRALRLYHHDESKGAWNSIPNVNTLEAHSVYTSTIALFALVEAKLAGMPWDGSETRRDDLIRQTIAWLLSQYRSSKNKHGWLNNPHEEHLSEVQDGLTAETYCALLTAELTDPKINLPDMIHQDARRYVLSCETRSNSYAIDASESRLTYLHRDGKTSHYKFTIRYLWWPWAIRCADLLLRGAEGRKLSTEQRVSLRRAIAHLVTGLGPKEVQKLLAGYSYAISESLWCLDTIERPAYAPLH